MRIYIQSAGTREDYHWLSESPGAVLLGWHSLLAEEDKVFALVAGYSCGSWHIELRNLLLSGVTDEIASRQIVFNICFSELKSEADVRALALAYLASELRRKRGERPNARFIPELAAAYKPTADGDFDFDTTVAHEWAEQVITRKEWGYSTPALGKILCTLSPDNQVDVKCLRNHIERTALTPKDGPRLIFSDMPIDTTMHADIILRFTDAATGTWKLVEQSEKSTPESMPQDTHSSACAQIGGKLGAQLGSIVSNTRLGSKLGSSKELEAKGEAIGSRIDSGVDWIKTQIERVRAYPDSGITTKAQPEKPKQKETQQKPFQTAINKIQE